jgi:hypothetical protein
VTCLEVRDRLAEFALGVLPEDAAADVERHLEWCPGCRREASDLQQGLTVVARSLPPAEPSPGLEERIVARMATSSADPRRRTAGRTRRSVLTLAAALFAAVILAVGAMGWAVAERGRIESFKETAAQQKALIDRFRSVIDDLPGGGLRTQADLKPILAGDGSGLALISTDPTPNADDWIFVSAILPSAGNNGYTMEVTNDDGRPIAGGPMSAQGPGRFLAYDITGENLSRAQYVTVYDGGGQAVLSGRVERTTPES